MISVPANPAVCLDAWYLDAIDLHDNGVLLRVDDLEVSLAIADGVAASRQLVDQLAPYTRGGAITRPDVYARAELRLWAYAVGTKPPMLRVGNDVVSTPDNHDVYVGDSRVELSRVYDDAIEGMNIRLPDGGLMQAALGLLVVAARYRTAGDEAAVLSRRIAAYRP